MPIQHLYTKANQKLADLNALPLKTLADGMEVFQYQSPIDFGEVESIISEPEMDLKLHYQEEEYQQKVFGGSYHLVPNEGKSWLTFEGQRFNLDDIHVHFPSEHTLNNQASKFEFHLVHSGPEGENLVIAVMYEGNSDDYIEENPKRRKMMEEIFYEGTNMTFNPADYLSRPLKYYHFVGSLTTPPYSGPVLWFVIDEMQYANLEVVRRVKKFVPTNNNRVVFPVRDRLVYHN